METCMSGLHSTWNGLSSAQADSRVLLFASCMLALSHYARFCTSLSAWCDGPCNDAKWLWQGCLSVLRLSDAWSVCRLSCGCVGCLHSSSCWRPEALALNTADASRLTITARWWTSAKLLHGLPIRIRQTISLHTIQGVIGMLHAIMEASNTGSSRLRPL